MDDRRFDNKLVEEMDVTARVAEDELRGVWQELEHRSTPSANQLRDRIAELAKEIVEQIDPPVPPEFGVYVIELDEKVLRKKRFLKKNARTYLPGRDCLYVGHTQLAPEHRFLQHLGNEHASPIVRRYGLRLRPEFYDAIDLFETREEAMAKEEELGELLRSEGYGVWYN